MPTHLKSNSEIVKSVHCLVFVSVVRLPLFRKLSLTTTVPAQIICQKPQRSSMAGAIKFMLTNGEMVKGTSSQVHVDLAYHLTYQ